jgi:hypothetical protein
MLEEREKPKSLVEDKLSKSSEIEKITFMRSLWVSTKDLSIHICKMFSARQSIVHHPSRPSARLNSKHKLSTSSSIKLSKRKISQKCSLKIWFLHSSFQMSKENKCRNNSNSKKRSSWKLPRRPLWSLLPILGRSWKASLFSR